MTMISYQLENINKERAKKKKKKNNSGDILELRHIIPKIRNVY